MLTREDFAEGRIVLSQKLEEFAPRVVAFNGKLTYEQFAQRKCKCGLQKERLYGARVFVLPATPCTEAPEKKEKKDNKEAIQQFRKLAQLLKRVEKERDLGVQGSSVGKIGVSTAPATKTGPFDISDQSGSEPS
jgi:hypothetical protein